MDMLEVDLTDAPQAQIGSEVTLWGHGPQVNGQTTLLSLMKWPSIAAPFKHLMCVVATRGS